jgi:hypothetical protein
MHEAMGPNRRKKWEAGHKEATPIIETFDFKAKFAETKAYAKVCTNFKFIVMGCKN